MSTETANQLLYNASLEPDFNPTDKLDENVLANLPFGTEILSVTPSGASSWVDTVCIKTRHQDGTIKRYFKKSQSGELGRRMMEGTFVSEHVFYEYSPENVPKPIAWGHYRSKPDTWYYLSDFREMVNEVPKVQEFVSTIVKIHRSSMEHPPKGKYGFPVPTHLANVPNDNSWEQSWEVWFTKAMRKMFEFEENSHGKDPELEELKKDLYEKVIPRLLRPLETGGRLIRPCLIHSDLWPGNCMPDAQSGEIVIFDSCAYWGHNEADLGSWRAPRYRMGRPFLKEYENLMGKSEPEEDWDDRNALYALRYDLLNSALFPNDIKFRKM
ncbi:MAG: hypothetical protein M1837_007191 [Sclerophora amabilis]|nr:MAG: hypothetical protein M1837_007191 [Sclerophora amabilis]